MDTTINNNKLNVAIIVLQEPARGSYAVEEFQTAHYHLLALTFPIWRRAQKTLAEEFEDCLDELLEWGP